MSLEEALNRNSEAVEKQNSLLEKMLAKAGVGTAAAAKTEDAGDGEGTTKKTRAGKGKTTRETDDAGDGEGGETKGNGLTVDEVKKVVGGWLAEFKEVEGDPETDARRAAIKGALAKLVGKEGAQVADVPVADLPRVITWIEKQKAKDNGFGAGRLTAVPSEGDGDGDEEDI